MSTRTATRDLVTIGQVWERKRDHLTFTVRQVWRTDRQVRLVSGEERVTVSFSDLRRFWRMHG
jgi:hypothetical protein